MSELLERASRSIPGGVNSPVRSFRGVGGDPVFIRRAEGAWLEASDGRRYIDYIGGYGPLILGHGHPEVLAAIESALHDGTCFGAPTEREIELAELIVSAVPSVEMVRLVNSGTEATMSALRLARAATERDRFVKFEGCYHGHGDAFLVAAGSGAATLGTPSSPGVPANVVDDTLLLPFNDLEAAERLFERDGDTIAAVFVEPIAGNMGCIPPLPGFLEGLRKLTEQHGALLVFDEVMTGFRVAWDCAQGRLGVTPDLTTLGKIIGGGLPIGAYGGRADLMRQIAPAGDVYQAGTLSGNPLAVAAGLATLRRLAADGGAVYEQLDATSARLAEGWEAIATERGVPLKVHRCGSMLGAFFSSDSIRDSASVDASDRERFGRVFHRLLDAGIHLPPSAYETLFVSPAHGDGEISRTLDALAAALDVEARSPR